MAINNHLGDIVCAAATSANNTTTAVPFLIPPGVTGVYLLTSAGDVTYNAGPDTGSIATPSTIAATTANQPLVANVQFGLNTTGYFQPSWPAAAGSAYTGALPVTWKIACYSTAGATIHVYQVRS